MVFLTPPVACSGEPGDPARLRLRMVEEQIKARGVKDERVLQAMKKVPRDLFVPQPYRESSYEDHPLPIGEGQTISQPFIVAFMTEAIDPKPDDRVLEIGTGSGYQAAVLGEVVKEVYSIEIIENLAKTLDGLGYRNIHVKVGDGYKGWPDQAPFDAIVVTAAPREIPEPLVQQLKEGGRIIIPVGRQGGVQRLIKGVKKSGRLITEEVLAVRFVPMVKDRE